MISRYKFLFCDYQSLPPISTQHLYKIHNQQANQLSTKSLSQSVSPATNELSSTNQIANKALKSLTNQRKELTKTTRNKKQKMQSNNSFRKPIGSPFRRPLIPNERKSPTNEVKIKKLHCKKFLKWGASPRRSSSLYCIDYTASCGNQTKWSSERCTLLYLKSVTFFV